MLSPLISRGGLEMKRLQTWFLFGALILMGSPAWGQPSPPSPTMLSPPAAAAGLQIYVFRVGQADSMLLVGPGPARKTLLVDLGVSSEAPFTGTATADHVRQRI